MQKQLTSLDWMKHCCLNKGDQKHVILSFVEKVCISTGSSRKRYILIEGLHSWKMKEYISIESLEMKCISVEDDLGTC